MSKRLFLVGLLAYTAVLGLFGQSVDMAKNLLKSNKLQEAKVQIDGVLADGQNQQKAEAWYTKLKVYNAIAANDQLRPQFPDARDQAFDALKKYVDLDEKDKKLLLLQMDSYKPINQIYQGYFQVGTNDYNRGKYESAFHNFSGALATNAFINAKGWTKYGFDTTCTLYAGMAAQKLGQDDTAAFYYGKLIEAKYKGYKEMKMMDTYLWLLDYYFQKKDDADARHFLALSKKQFPDEPFWAVAELNNLRQKGNKDSLFAKHEEIITHFPNNSMVYYSYGEDLYLYVSDTSSGRHPANYAKLLAKAKESLKKSLDLEPKNMSASLLLGHTDYLIGLYSLELIKKVKTPDKAGLQKVANGEFQEAAIWLAQTHLLLVASQEINPTKQESEQYYDRLKDTLITLISVYQAASEPDKIDEYTRKLHDLGLRP